MPDKDYLKWVRTLDCANCMRVGPSLAHHLKGELHQGGVGLKSPDHLTMPLCNKCHTSWHNAENQWGDKMNRLYVQRHWLLSTLIKAFEQDMIKTCPFKDNPF